MRLALVAVALLAAAAAPASAAEPRTSLPDVEDEVMCVSCRIPLNVAESPQADAQRDEIRRLIGQGLTKDEVKDQLVAQYGENVLAVPEDDGVAVITYVVPVAIALAALGLYVLLVPRWRRRTAASPPAGRAATEAELQRLDDDLARYE